RGDDDRPVQPSRRRKSVSVEKTYHEDKQTLTHWLQELDDLLERLERRVDRLDANYIVQGLTVKVRYSDFRIVSADQSGEHLDREVFERLLTQLWERHPAPARLLGIGLRLRDLK
ncbi:MAG TPA: DNA polymerase IV, partial [Alcanivorax sp.]|nr:DNA polymerase IV [Alcanivorax sp.]